MTNIPENFDLKSIFAQLSHESFLRVLKKGFLVSSDDRPHHFIIGEAVTSYDLYGDGHTDVCMQCECLLDGSMDDCWEADDEFEHLGYLCNRCVSKIYNRQEWSGLTQQAVMQLLKEFNVEIDFEKQSFQEGHIQSKIRELVSNQDLPIELPLFPWDQLQYAIGPIQARIYISGSRIVLLFTIGTFERYFTNSDLLDDLISEFGIPNMRISASLAPQPVVNLSIELTLGNGGSERILLAAFYDTADIAVEVLKRGIQAGALIDPDLSRLKEFGLMPPALAEELRESFHWENPHAGSALLFKANGMPQSTNQEPDNKPDGKRIGIAVKCRDNTDDVYISDYENAPDGQDTFKYSFSVAEDKTLQIFFNALVWDGYGYDVHPPKLVAEYKYEEYMHVDYYDFTYYNEDE